jgi:predicted acyl esterase
VIEHTVIARDGHALEVRLYTPEGLPDGPAPALLFAHGGGWFQCSLAVYDGPCRALGQCQRLRDRRRGLPAGAGTSVPGSAA